MIYPIVIYGDEVLRKRCREIGPDYPEVKKLAEDMFLTLEEAEGVGLAAPQIGKDIRLFIVDCTPWAEDDPSCADYKRAFLNPEIYEYSAEKKTYNEGCLSFPGQFGIVERPDAVTVKAQNRKGEWFEVTGTALLARALCHEIDHLDGIVFTDHATRMLEPNENPPKNKRRVTAHVKKSKAAE